MTSTTQGSVILIPIFVAILIFQLLQKKRDFSIVTKKERKRMKYHILCSLNANKNQSDGINFLPVITDKKFEKFLKSTKIAKRSERFFFSGSWSFESACLIVYK